MTGQRHERASFASGPRGSLNSRICPGLARYHPRVDDGIQFFGYPQGYFLTAWLLVGTSLVVLVLCLAFFRRAPVPAAAGALGSLLAGLTWGVYLGHDLMMKSGKQPTSLFSLPDRHPSVLLWAHLAGAVLVGLAVVLALLALGKVQERA
jgi:hypothetical protein